MQQIFFLKNQYRFFLPAIAFVIVSTILFTLPASAFPNENWYDRIPIFDKWVHVGIFIILSFLLCRAIYKLKPLSGKLIRYFILIGVLCLFYGIAIEYIQLYWVAHRTFDLGDIIADGAGAAAGVLYSFKRYIKK